MFMSSLNCDDDEGSRVYLETSLTYVWSPRKIWRAVLLFGKLYFASLREHESWRILSMFLNRDGKQSKNVYLGSMKQQQNYLKIRRWLPW